VGQRLIIVTAKFLERSPDVWSEFPDEDLSWVALTSEVDLFGIYLVGNINEENIKEVVGDVVRLENDLHLV